jgi:hypothetical protein
MDLLFELFSKFIVKLIAHFAVWEPIKEFGVAAWVAVVGVVALIFGGIYSAFNRSNSLVAGKRRRKRK